MFALLAVLLEEVFYASLLAGLDPFLSLYLALFRH